MTKLRAIVFYTVLLNGCISMQYQNNMHLNNLTYCTDFASDYGGAKLSALEDAAHLAVQRANVSIQEVTGKGSVRLVYYNCKNKIKIEHFDDKGSIGFNRIAVDRGINGKELGSTTIVLNKKWVDYWLYFDPYGDWEDDYHYAVVTIGRLIMHEIGHGLGLDHSIYPLDIMFPVYNHTQPLNFDDIVFRDF